MKLLHHFMQTTDNHNWYGIYSPLSIITRDEHELHKIIELWDVEIIVEFRYKK